MDKAREPLLHSEYLVRNPAHYLDAMKQTESLNNCGIFLALQDLIISFNFPISMNNKVPGQIVKVCSLLFS